MQFKATPVRAIVGDAIADALPTDGKPWYRSQHLILLNLILLVPLLSAATSGYDGSLMNGLQSMDEWKDEFNHPKGTMLGFINAAQNIGGVIILPIGGWLSDYIGRKWTLTIGLIGIVIATIIQASSMNLAQLIASRFIVGAAGLLAAQPAPLLVAELSYPTFRGKLTSLYWGFFYLGAILASWSCFGCNGRGDTWAWRIPTIVQGAFPCVQLAFLYFVPESPRWLVSKGKVDEAREILVRYHAGGDTQSALVATELIEISNALDMERMASQTTWKSLIATPGNRKRTFIAVTLGIFSQWSGTAVVSYYLTLVLDTIGITSSTTQTLINGFLQIFNLVFATLAAFMVDFLGRRFLWMWSSIGMLISYVIWTACSAVFSNTGSPAAGRCVLGFIFIFFFHYDIAYTPLLLGYPTEIFPYSLRSKGVSLVLFCCYASLVISSFCNSIALDNIGWKYYIVFCVILAFVVVNNYLFYPETKGYSLEEIAVLFDGEQAADLEISLAKETSALDSSPSFKKQVEVDHLEDVKSNQN